MIKINLLPEELRAREKNETTEIPKAKLIIAIAILFVLVTVFFYFDFHASGSKLRKMDKQWAEFQPQAQILGALENEILNVLSPEKDFLERFVTAERPLTYVLEWLSEFLPVSAWIIQVRMENSPVKNNLVVRGLALPTKEVSSIESIEIYLNELKKKMPAASLSLTTARQFEEGVEVTQFTAIFEWPVGDKKK